MKSFLSCLTLIKLNVYNFRLQSIQKNGRLVLVLVDLVDLVSLI